MENITLHKGYQADEILRHGFNQLIGKTFGLNFENWYQHGYWKDQYKQYSLFQGDKAISNISAYTMEFDWNGERKRWIQYGGVATDEAYRKQGLSRILMEEAIKDDLYTVDSIFLLANHTVHDFYPKFGFIRCPQWQCTKDVHIETERTAVPVSMHDKNNWFLLEKAIQKSVSNSLLEMKQNPELVMFYVTEFMQENVYFIKELDAYVVAELEGAELVLCQVYAPEKVDLDQVYKAFGKDVKHVTLEFTPLDSMGYVQNEITDPDEVLFVLGKDVQLFQEQKLKVPVLAHT